MTFQEIKEFQQSLPNGSSDVNGVIYTQHRNIDNKYNFSFHIICAKTKSQYNVWFCKIREEASISFYDTSLDMNVFENHFKQNQNVFTTSNIKELKNKVLEIIRNF